MTTAERLIEKGCSIKETARIYGTTIDTLYYYEHIGLVVPRRNPMNSYRIYGPEDFAKLNVVTELRAMGFSFEQIRQYFDHHSFTSTMEVMNDEMRHIDQQISYLMDIKNGIIESLQRYTHAVATAQDGKVAIAKEPERHCALVSRNCVAYDDIPYAFARYTAEHHGNLRTLRTIPCYQVDVTQRINGCFPAKTIMLYCQSSNFEASYILKAGLYASLTFPGSFVKCVDAYEQISAEIARQGYEACGDPIEFCLIGEYESDNFDDYVSRMEIPVRCL